MHLRSLLAVAAAACVVLAGCGDDAGTDPSTATTRTAPQSQPGGDGADTGESPSGGGGKAGGGSASGGSGAPPEGKPGGPAESSSADPRVTALERAAGRAVRAYVAALDRRDGAGACMLLVPGALDEVELPEERGDCAAALEASIGYRDPRGLPVWQSAEATHLRSVEIDGQMAKVVVTTATRFADRDEISIEDDIVYLARDGDGWLVAKPSSTLYRAVGIADVPPSVLAPPG